MRMNAFAARERAEPPVQPVNICGVLVHAQPDQRVAVKAALEELPGTEVHTMTDEGKLIVVVEDADGQWASETITRFYDVEGILSVALVYHHFDNELEGEIVP
ncbi:Periplasmic nitrate reductase accessory protein [Magnetospirillum sp. LM-5]|uniref:chaperone NapD n=1 Tax=Magnetospirillum sp. LM-5 TaxID=2681466 RepID=UPI00137CAAFB|nr:chaperone NapD [Magnetospirillum sp. LM-5]CAA7611407.1 Periplasmic nitrate reductase accessory protein [Magnetospirillum sp. LM-5]